VEVEGRSGAANGAVIMPGVLKRNHDLVEPDGLDGAGDAPDRKRVAREQVNGDTPQVNGAYPSGAGFPDNGIVPDPSLAATARELTDANEPPPIHHISGSYVPLTTVLERLAQETHNELEQVIGELADMQATQVNGYGSAHAVQINVQKKERLFNFAQNARTKFIKLLVLSQWSRESGAVSKLIDLHSWIVFRKEEYRNAVNWMGELKRMTATMKSPPPDLRTALEVLSTGRADWIPDPLELEPEPMSAEEMLRGLRTINTELTIRLNLHEQIPPEMMDFSIASGRATFRVHDEFELDLSIGSEDPSSQLFFIDFRFAFEPCSPELPEGPLRTHIEDRVNEVLRTDGLTGCYEFLHDLIVTHKLSILRQQAFDLSRGRWSEHIKVEPVHRALVVQYWINRSGRKSWIEIGVRRRRRKDGAEGDTSGLGVRWHRHGQEISDPGLEVGDSELSLETLLERVIATHTNYILKETKRKLKRDPIYEKGILTVKHRAHQTEPAECALNVQVSVDAVVRLSQEPISGFFAISPTSEMHSRAEMETNRLPDPAAGLHQRLSTLRCRGLLQQVRQLARVRRWQVWDIRTNQETVQRIFHVDNALVVFFRLPRWDRKWLLALATNGAGDKWWLVETQDAPRNPSPMDFAGNSYQPLKKSLRVNLRHNEVLVFDPLHEHMSTVERTAAAVLSQFVDVRALTGRKLEYHQLPPRRPSRRLIIPELLIHFPPESGAVKPWCKDIVKSVFVGISRLDGMATTVITGRLVRRIPNIERFQSHMDAALAFHPTNGQFSFRLKSPIGESSIDEVQDRFQRIGSLVRLIHATGKNQLDCTRLALDSFTFNYGASPADVMGISLAPGLSATVTFVPSPSTSPTELSVVSKPLERLALPQGNPHLRIIDHLNRILNSGRQGFDWVLNILRCTLELMRSFSAMEHRPRQPGVRVYILPRSAVSYQVRYIAPRVKVGFDVQLRSQSDEQVVWLSGYAAVPVRAGQTGAAGSPSLPSGGDAGSKSSPSKSRPTTAKSHAEPLETEAEKTRLSHLRGVWTSLCKTRGPAFEGLGTGMSAQVDSPGSVAAMMAQMDQALSVAIEEVGMEASKEEEAEKKESEMKGKEEKTKGKDGGKGPKAREVIALD
jgi:mediator of RNA polymerase II transcription subunit 14